METQTTADDVKVSDKVIWDMGWHPVVDVQRFGDTCVFWLKVEGKSRTLMFDARNWVRVIR